MVTGEYVCVKCEVSFVKKFLSPSDKRKFKGFCSRKCANSHNQSDETNRKRSETVTKNHILCEGCGNKSVRKICVKCSKRKMNKCECGRDTVGNSCWWCRRGGAPKPLIECSKCGAKSKREVCWNCSKRAINKPPKLRYCHKCSLLITDKNKYCGDCRFELIEIYRPACKFKFNVYHFPEEFCIPTLEKDGWYTPYDRGVKEKNVKGISRDHMFSVTDGFKNKVPPEIMKHPANCKLIKQNANVRKGAKSSISYEELISRIAEWDKRYCTPTN